MALEGHTGENLATLTLQTLLARPRVFGLLALRGRLACVTGDGALCRGGLRRGMARQERANKFGKAFIHEPVLYLGPCFGFKFQSD